MGPARLMGGRFRAARPDRDKGALLTYEIRKDGRVMYRRNFGEAKDENEVVSATVNAEGLINVMVYFPSLQQTREFGLLLQKDGSLRAIYNRSERGEYTIKDSKSTSRPARRRLSQEPLQLTTLNSRSEFSSHCSGTFVPKAPFSCAFNWRRIS